MRASFLPEIYLSIYLSIYPQSPSTAVSVSVVYHASGGAAD
jgi:hypothetical protein